MYIHWEKELELGNELIDTQHRIMVLLCRKLDIAIKTGRSEQTVRWVMLELRKFTEFHFLSEENLMHEIGYLRVDVMTPGGPSQAYVLATNVYHKTRHGWRMVAHHASPGNQSEVQEIHEAPQVLH